MAMTGALRLAPVMPVRSAARRIRSERLLSGYILLYTPIKGVVTDPGVASPVFDVQASADANKSIPPPEQRTLDTSSGTERSLCALYWTFKCCISVRLTHVGEDSVTPIKRKAIRSYSDG